MTNTLTVTIQVGDGKANTTTFGLPSSDDDYDFEASASSMDEDTLDTAMPPDIEGASMETSSSDELTPPGLSIDQDPEMDEDNAIDDNDDGENIQPPEA